MDRHSSRFRLTGDDGHLYKVAIVIKALDEEDKIEAAIKSALAAVTPLGGAVILADSASTDRTVEIAKQYPIDIVQLASRNDRSCGVGAELGYRYCNAEYIYILDGDMTVRADFLLDAVRFLDSEPRIGAVGGVIREVQLSNLEFRRRSRVRPPIGDVDRLNQGGLYRQEAIHSAGFLSDRNLFSYEEFDIGSRLRARGWRLVRLEHVAADHYGYTIGAYRLLMNRIRSGYALGIGQALRAALADDRIWGAIAALKELRLWFAVWIYWTFSVLIIWNAPSSEMRIIALFSILVLPIAILTAIRRSVTEGLYAWTSWSIFSAGLIVGFIRPRLPPEGPIPVRIVKRGARL